MQIDLFLESQAADRNASLNTLEAYQRDLNHFTKWINKSALNVLKTDIEAYIQDLFSKKFIDNSNSVFSNNTGYIIIGDKHFNIDDLIDLEKFESYIANL